MITLNTQERILVRIILLLCTLTVCFIRCFKSK